MAQDWLNVLVGIHSVLKVANQEHSRLLGVVSVQPEPDFILSWFWGMGPRLLECLAALFGSFSGPKVGEHYGNGWTSCRHVTRACFPPEHD